MRAHKSTVQQASDDISKHLVSMKQILYGDGGAWLAMEWFALKD